MSHVNPLLVQNVLGLLAESGLLSKDLQPEFGERLVDDRSSKILN